MKSISTDVPAIGASVMTPASVAVETRRSRITQSFS